jgi:phage terminase small subunit
MGTRGPAPRPAGLKLLNGTSPGRDSGGRLVTPAPKFRREAPVNHPEFHAPSGFCEPAGWSVTCLE